MKDYKDQDSCETCQHVFVRIDWDEPEQFFCTASSPPRPLCLSDQMDETELPEDKLAVFNPYSLVWEKAQKRWDTWATPRRVKPYGICKLYKKEN